MKKIHIIFLIVILSFLLIVLAVFPEKYIQTTFQGIILWAVSVLPSLLPFFFLTKLLIFTNCLTKLSKFFSKTTKILFRCNGLSGYVFLISIISGYPIGASMISSLYESNLIDSDEATRMSTFCSTSGPMFIIGSVGISMFFSKQIGFLLFFSHVLSALICGLIFRNYGKFSLKTQHYSQKTQNANILYDSIYQSVISVLIVGGFVSIFYTFSQIATDFNLLFFIEKPLSILIKDYSLSFCQGLIECTKGCKLLSLSTTKLSVSLACSLISFGGLSIIFQSIIFLKKAKVKLKIFLFSKILQMVISFSLCYLFYFLIIK